MHYDLSLKTPEVREREVSNKPYVTLAMWIYRKPQLAAAYEFYRKEHVYHGIRTEQKRTSAYAY